MIYAFFLFFIASSVLIFNYKKITVLKNQVRNASVNYLNENLNYTLALISYSAVLFSLSWLVKISYAANDIKEILIVSAFLGILHISKSLFFSPYGLRNLK